MSSERYFETRIHIFLCDLVRIWTTDYFREMPTVKKDQSSFFYHEAEKRRCFENILIVLLYLLWFNETVKMVCLWKRLPGKDEEHAWGFSFGKIDWKCWKIAEEIINGCGERFKLIIKNPDYVVFLKSFWFAAHAWKLYEICRDKHTKYLFLQIFYFIGFFS